MKLANTTWGNWELDRETLCLIHIKERYEIPLFEITTSAQALDWIIQISAKKWATKKDVGQLVAAIQDLLKPQENLCSFGTSSEIEDPNTLIKINEQQTLAMRLAKALKKAKAKTLHIDGIQVTTVRDTIDEITAAEKIVIETLTSVQ